jgi:hypothetical protein
MILEGHRKAVRDEAGTLIRGQYVREGGISLWGTGQESIANAYKNNIKENPKGSKSSFYMDRLGPLAINYLASTQGSEGIKLAETDKEGKVNEATGERETVPIENPSEAHHKALVKYEGAAFINKYLTDLAGPVGEGAVRAAFEGKKIRTGVSLKEGGHGLRKLFYDTLDDSVINHDSSFADNVGSGPKDKAIQDPFFMKYKNLGGSNRFSKDLGDSPVTSMQGFEALTAPPNSAGGFLFSLMDIVSTFLGLKLIQYTITTVSREAADAKGGNLANDNLYAELNKEIHAEFRMRVYGFQKGYSSLNSDSVQRPGF